MGIDNGLHLKYTMCSFLQIFISISISVYNSNTTENVRYSYLYFDNNDVQTYIVTT